MKRILVVDDEPDLRLVARLALERLAGHEVVEAADGDGALAVLDTVPPDLVLLDVKMPRADGPATLERLRGHPKGEEVDVVFLTATSGRAERDRLEGLGVRGVVTKPIDPVTFADELARMLGWEGGS